MSEQMWIRSHVQQMLQDVWSVCRVEPDADGDYFFRVGTAACWVSVLSTAPIMVRVFAHAATGLKPTLAVLRELNDIERRALSVSVVIEGDAVVVAQTVSPVGLCAEVLAQAMVAVGGVADDVGVLLASMFGGATPFPAEPQPTQQDAP